MSVPILAAVDPVTVDLAPARFASLLAAIIGAPLTLAAVHAGEDVLDPLAGAQFGEELGASGDDALERALAEVADDPVEADTLAVGAGSAPRGLELMVEQLGPGLLVIGAAGTGRLLGSTGARLLSGTRCPVARVTRGWQRPPAIGTVGVGFVDTVEGRAALHGAHDVARRAGARLRVLVVLKRAWMGRDAEDVRVRAEAAAEAAVGRLLGAPFDIDVSTGEPADVLTGVSGELDLLVCGGRGYGPDGSALLGGVGRRVVEEARCSVIVLTRGPRAWREGFFDIAGAGATRGDTA
jgi:nucleotide-binding universal stress UspA family protein